MTLYKTVRSLTAPTENKAGEKYGQKYGQRHGQKGTVLDYLREYGNYTFLEKPLTEVDSLALCQLSYLKFDGLVPDVREDGDWVTLKSLTSHTDFDKLFADTRFEKVNRELVQGMLAGRRFSTLRLNYYVNVVEKQRETQFSAITCILDDGTLYVAYRGTDESIVGWKEAFNMSFLSPVPGQEYGVKYLSAVAERFCQSFYVGGHSKGGNLAVYSAMNCPAPIRDRIIRIYNWDGPGFRPQTLERGHYEMIADRVMKVLPHSALIGMLFESDMRFQVVESRTSGLTQHDPYTWLVEEDHLVRVDGIGRRCLRRDRALNKWLLSLDEGRLQTIVDTLYKVITASQVDNLIEFRHQWKRNIKGMLKALFGNVGEKERQRATEGTLRSKLTLSHR